MRLADLEEYNPITIQCHDNPDADALGAGYGLYCYFKSKGKKVRLIYSGANQIQKSNLRLMVENLKLPVEYVAVEKTVQKLDGLLITVDCQYGAGNVTRFEADVVAIIDHHQQEIEGIPLSVIQSNLGSCCTLVWKLMNDEGFVVNDMHFLGTALYYGLYMDTKQFAELFNPLDMDLKESVPYEKSLITKFSNANISLHELEVAGLALLRYSYNDDYDFAVIRSKPCDPNILGIISDFVLQVDLFDSCVVFSQMNDGFKFSVRSCIPEVNASELAEYLAEGMGSGGGHYQKAGGFISMKFYEEKYPTLHAEGYFNNRMVEYFDSFQIIHADEFESDLTAVSRYEKKALPMGYVEADNLLPPGTPVILRTAKGDTEMKIDDNLYFVIGYKGEVLPMSKGEFVNSYQMLKEKYRLEDCGTKPEYAPVIKNRNNGQKMTLTDYTWKCLPVRTEVVYAKPLESGIKLFTLWDKDRYQLGRPGDYLAAKAENPRDLFVIPRAVFEQDYIAIKA